MLTSGVKGGEHVGTQDDNLERKQDDELGRYIIHHTVAWFFILCSICLKIISLLIKKDDFEDDNSDLGDSPSWRTLATTFHSMIATERHDDYFCSHLLEMRTTAPFPAHLATAVLEMAQSPTVGRGTVLHHCWYPQRDIVDVLSIHDAHSVVPLIRDWWQHLFDVREVK